MSGCVYLIGAGPGDPGLLTLAGAAAIREATAIVHDALVGEGILNLARSEAIRYDVGKRAQQQHIQQEDINQLLISLGQAGQVVARVKGGDPFVFGRGAEEAAALATAAVPFRIIPGVSSAIAVPAAAGIPVTYRGLAASVAIVAAHRMDGADAPNWDAIVKLDTVVLLMSATHLAQAAERMVKAGRAAHTPVACIQSGTLPEQREVIGDLSDIAARVAAANLGTPLITIIGEVVRVRAQLGFVSGAWVETQHE